ncbi:MAG: hypothetical protein IT251_04765 [Chitinophagaceae bacterium]|nr:hypothetical protein [Chitinophagaceae bacterium]
MIFNNNTEQDAPFQNNEPENTEFQQTNVHENSENENEDVENKDLSFDFIETTPPKNIVELEIIKKTTPKTEKKPENKEALPDFIETTPPKNIVEPEIIKKTTPKTEKKPENKENTSTRLTITTSFVQNEVEHLKHIIAARIEAGVTRNNSHFIRQCVDFTINSGFVFKEKRFGLPENTPKLILEDAFFNNNK